MHLPIFSCFCPLRQLVSPKRFLLQWSTSTSCEILSCCDLQAFSTMFSHGCFPTCVYTSVVCRSLSLYATCIKTHYLKGSNYQGTWIALFPLPFCHSLCCLQITLKRNLSLHLYLVQMLLLLLVTLPYHQCCSIACILGSFLAKDGKAVFMLCILDLAS